MYNDDQPQGQSAELIKALRNVVNVIIAGQLQQQESFRARLPYKGYEVSTIVY